MIERYETQEMRALWNDEAVFMRWLQIEVTACEAFFARGEIPPAEMQQIHTKAHYNSVQRIREIEQETHHDVVAFVRATAEQIGEPAARHLHRGLTSSDIVDTGLAMALRDSLDVILGAASTLAAALKKRALEHKLTPCVGRTHGIHAEPTTFGLRLAGFYTEVNRSIERLKTARDNIAFGKLSGAVGTFSQTDPQFEAFVLNKLGLQAEPIATQVIPRDRHAELVNALALLGAALERMAMEVRSLQRTDVREVEEPFVKGQAGSSAMPHKRNPIISERVCGMARLLRSYSVSSQENICLWHDRDISHSSVERVMLPDAFHLAHYMLRKMTTLIEGLRVYPKAMLENLNKTRGLVFSQNVLGVLLKKGMDRTAAYKAVQHAAMQVWEEQVPDFKTALKEHLSDVELQRAFDFEPYFCQIDALFQRAGIKE
jgi:adenylosuccinate lyase